MDFQTLYKEAAVRQVYNFYSNYQDHYKSISMDLEDLEQEVKIEILSKLKTPKVGELDDEDLLKYVNTLTQRTLIKFIRKSVKTDTNIVKEGIYAVDKKKNNDPEKIIEFLRTEYKLNDYDYSLLYKRFVEKKQYKDIAAELGIDCKRSGVSTISGRIRRILRKHKWYDFIYNFVFSENQVIEDQQLHFMDSHFDISILDDVKDLLTEKQHYILTERIINNVEEKDIAATLNITRQGVNKIYNKAISKLKRILKKELLK